MTRLVETLEGSEDPREAFRFGWTLGCGPCLRLQLHRDVPCSFGDLAVIRLGQIDACPQDPVSMVGVVERHLDATRRNVLPRRCRVLPLGTREGPANEGRTWNRQGAAAF